MEAYEMAMNIPFLTPRDILSRRRTLKMNLDTTLQTRFEEELNEPPGILTDTREAAYLAAAGARLGRAIKTSHKLHRKTIVAINSSTVSVSFDDGSEEDRAALEANPAGYRRVALELVRKLLEDIASVRRSG